MNTAVQVFGEAMRVPRYSRHVDEPKAPITLDGTTTLKKLEVLWTEKVQKIRETVKSAKGTSYQRRLRRDAATLYTEIHSHPLSVEAFRRDEKCYRPQILSWAERVLTHFERRMPKGIEWAAVLHLDETHVHLHILAINVEDPKLDANKLHAGKRAAAEVRASCETPSAICSLPRPIPKPLPPRPRKRALGKRPETIARNKVHNATRLEAWRSASRKAHAENAQTLAAWKEENRTHLKAARKLRGEVPEMVAYRAAMRQFQDDYHRAVGEHCGLLRDGPRKARLSTKQHAARKAIAAQMQGAFAELDRRALDFAQKQAALRDVIAALSDGRAEISGGDIVMEDMPASLKALGDTAEDWMIRAVLDLLVRAGEAGVGALQPARDEEFDGPGMQ
ncbi:Mob protein [Thioclava sp. JE_KL1]|uniref:Mob protein n=1 Tax=Thioclava sp. JE_KL1 TaxID=2651187 RepID=UPI00128C3D05|nr:Mob protein [Thioclava sp. JE_KL1]MPQ95283.1 Mob protein [Thioclava sp. JE_KL1]